MFQYGAMLGLDAHNATSIDGLTHLRQSVTDILRTPIGSRVMRRAYGSRLFELIDQPFSSAVRLAIIAATAEALMLWEPRIEVLEVSLRSFEPGHVTIDLLGKYLPKGDEITLDGIEVR